MEYRQLGSSGLKVSILGLGGNVFGQHEGFKHYVEKADTKSILDRAVDLGIDFIDTADMYSNGVSETYLGKAIAGRRERFIIASKVGLPVGEGPNQRGLSRGHIMDSLEGTLRRLDTDYVDLYYAHRPDPSTPIEETLRCFDDLVHQGKVRYVGCSNFAGWQIAVARGVAAYRGYSPFIVSQSHYNLFERSLETEIAPCCAEHGMSLVAYFPLAQGVLTGKYRRGKEIPPNTRGWENPEPGFSRHMTDVHLAAVELLDAWASDHGHLVSELAIAWVAAQPLVCSVLTGVTSIDQLEANASATDWKLTKDEVREIENLVGGVARLS